MAGSGGVLPGGAAAQRRAARALLHGAARSFSWQRRPTGAPGRLPCGSANDADLLEPVRLVRTVLGLPVGVIKVEGGQRACVFAKQADFVRTVRRGHFTAAQLPPTVTTADGKTISKPQEW